MWLLWVARRGGQVLWAVSVWFLIGSVCRRTAQQWQLPRDQSRILSHVPMRMQLSVSVAGKIVAIEILVWPHVFFSLSPKTLLVVLYYWLSPKICGCLKVEVLCERYAVLAFASSVFQESRIPLPELLRKLLQLRPRLLWRVGDRPGRLCRRAGTVIIVVPRSCRSGRCREGPLPLGSVSGGRTRRDRGRAVPRLQQQPPCC